MPAGFYIHVLLPLLALGAAVTVVALLAVRRLPPRARGFTVFLLVTAALIPYAAHAAGTIEYVRHFGPPAAPPAGVYPGLRLFSVLTPLALAAVLLGSAVAIRRLPVLVAAAPPLMGLVYWRALLPLIFRDPPEFVMIDNMPLIWLFAYSLVAAAALGTIAGKGRV